MGLTDVARSLLFQRNHTHGSRVDRGGLLMMDLLFLIVVVGFFAGAIAYVEGCERL